MAEVWEFVHAFRDWADLVGLVLGGAILTAVLAYGIGYVICCLGQKAIRWINQGEIEDL